MSRKARTRAAAVAAVALAIGLLLATGAVPGVSALFTAETENTNSQFGGDWVDAPTLSGSPSVVGLGAALTWAVGAHGVTGQEIWYADNGSTNSCTGVTYTGLVTGTSLAANATSITGTGTPNDAVASGDGGDYICYQVRSTNTSGWYTLSNYSSAVQVGLVPVSISFSGTGSGNMVSGQTFTITFNQNFSYTSSSFSVSAASGTVTLGAIGTISGGSITQAGTCTASTVSGTGTKVMTITLGGCPNGNGNKIKVTAGGTGTYTGAASVTSSAGGVSQCTKSNCQPTFSY